jgi:hypothetical protein
MGEFCPNLQLIIRRIYLCKYLEIIVLKEKHCLFMMLKKQKKSVYEGYKIQVYILQLISDYLYDEK